MDDKATVIDADSSFEGRLTGKDGRILGTFQGEIELQGRLHLGEGSKVEAKVKATTSRRISEAGARSAGRLRPTYLKVRSSTSTSRASSTMLPYSPVRT